MNADFGLGYLPHTVEPGKELAAKCGKLLTVPMFRAAASPRPKGLSLTGWRQRDLPQGPVGTCWVHGPTNAAEMAVAAAGEFEPVQLSRAYIAHHAAKLIGRNHNAADGGWGGYAFLVASDDPQRGRGCCLESTWPYRAQRRYLATAPSAEAEAEAPRFRLGGLADVAGPEQARDLIARLQPTSLGIWWPHGWSSGSVGADGRVATIGRGSFGHEICISGYVEAGVWDAHAWFEITNSHGLIYRPLPPELARHVVGYWPVEPTRTNSFWVREDVLMTVIGYGNAQWTAFATEQGFRDAPYTPGRQL